MKQSAHNFYKWLGFVFAALMAGLAVLLGLYEELAGQYVLFYATATFAIVLWGWHHFSVRWVYSPDGLALDSVSEEDQVERPERPAAGEEMSAGHFARRLVLTYKFVILGILALLALFLIVSFAVENFYTTRNIIASIVLAVFLAIAAILNRVVTENTSAFVGVTVFLGLFIIGSLVVEGFFSAINVKSMLVFAAFLGLACIGQTLVALLGGLDLSIPYVIGAANVGLLYLLGLGLPSWLAVIFVLILGAIIGVVNGLLSFRLQGQALIVTLGVGFAVAGGTQILTSIGTRYSGNVFGVVPGWLTNIAAMNGRTFGLDFPPVIVIWLGAAVILSLLMRNTVYGRNLYALGGSRIAAKRLSISEHKYWVTVYGISGAVAAITGMLLLGWSGGGFIGVGNPYLFMTLAAVVIGGTSLLGGWGGYGFTVIGVLVLQVLSSFLVGIGLSYEGQQFVFGLLIIPMVAMYARSPHIRTRI
jgi:ribose transport system permease protein